MTDKNQVCNRTRVFMKLIKNIIKHTESGLNFKKPIINYKIKKKRPVQCRILLKLILPKKKTLILL